MSTKTQTKIAKHSLALVRGAGAFGESPLYYIESANYDADGEIDSYQLNELRLAGQVELAVRVSASRVIAVYPSVPRLENQEQ